MMTGHYYGPYEDDYQEFKVSPLSVALLFFPVDTEIELTRRSLSNLQKTPQEKNGNFG
jgi:hypothetical protein